MILYIYVVAETGSSLVKIGSARNVERRLSSLRTASPLDLVVRARWTGTVCDEKGLHERFKAQRVRGEWFEFEATDPVSAVSDALGRAPEPETVGASSPGKRKKREYTPPPPVGDIAVYRRVDGLIVSERRCMNLCVSGSGGYVGQRGKHTHSFTMTDEEYRKYGPSGPPI